MKSSTFQTDETVDLHVAWLIQRERQKRIEKRRGIGSVIFVIGIPLAILGFAMSLVAYSEIVGKDTIPSFRITGPVFIVVAFVMFIIGAVLAEVLSIRRTRKQQYEVESIELQTEFLQEKDNASKEDSSVVEITRDNVRRSGDESLFQQFKRSSSVISESLANMIPSRNCKIEPHECEEV
ncbi:uncharacterized protein LOC110456788 [Mizuhopecten yessoensis]|uniref:Uncharacterized protein n=1 Tax=Mizuhopecten yessoensis TaxID=6573 RepID=A0A210QAA0_MIZYE|nr:uncharacterized protein LOC110456788 [Mizuhopecten yessoensis]OWF45653.1 hypothetical protein KP79_PYT05955 [Mizuhopecten yessoensis]